MSWRLSVQEQEVLGAWYLSVERTGGISTLSQIENPTLKNLQAFSLGSVSLRRILRGFPAQGFYICSFEFWNLGQKKEPGEPTFYYVSFSILCPTSLPPVLSSGAFLLHFFFCFLKKNLSPSVSLGTKPLGSCGHGMIWDSHQTVQGSDREPGIFNH